MFQFNNSLIICYHRSSLRISIVFLSHKFFFRSFGHKLQSDSPLRIRQPGGIPGFRHSSARSHWQTPCSLVSVPSTSSCRSRHVLFVIRLKGSLIFQISIVFIFPEIQHLVRPLDAGIQRFPFILAYGISDRYAQVIRFA